jgi:serine/threonine protein kinase
LTYAPQESRNEQIPEAFERLTPPLVVDHATTVHLEGTGTWRTPVLPGYRIVRQLGAGGIGVVYQAWQQSLNRNVAVKIIRPDVFSGPRELARFRREAETAARLKDPPVVHVYEIAEHQGQCYVVLEYVEGCTLARKIASKDLDIREKAALPISLSGQRSE